MLIELEKEVKMATNNLHVGQIVALPPIDRSFLELWFERAELTFRVKKIDDQLVKFASVVQALDPVCAVYARKYLVDLDKYQFVYDSLKKDLLLQAGKSPLEKIQVGWGGGCGGGWGGGCGGG